MKKFFLILTMLILILILAWATPTSDLVLTTEVIARTPSFYVSYPFNSTSPVSSILNFKMDGTTYSFGIHIMDAITSDTSVEVIVSTGRMHWINADGNEVSLNSLYPEISNPGALTINNVLGYNNSGSYVNNAESSSSGWPSSVAGNTWNAGIAESLGYKKIFTYVPNSSIDNLLICQFNIGLKASQRDVNWTAGSYKGHVKVEYILP